MNSREVELITGRGCHNRISTGLRACRVRDALADILISALDTPYCLDEFRACIRFQHISMPAGAQSLFHHLDGIMLANEKNYGGRRNSTNVIYRIDPS
jgi:hypothetical protein